ncbi:MULTISPECIES: glycoside hydrolase family 15 protein [Bradyrhizobium]|uniref:GH15 family glucan-1,4-alpha-glucosidase n=1 Tax=Bradyrhizobium ottawaense TaxID=931866 RepID=A0ABV4FJQ3_9BRAD|nr:MULTISPECIES: glycoside hydrolase family 15 protein [Bradyrhizobium]MBR1289193.1 glycoside hydrolase family 15 protein [Bradyrhizobium ottawaense]MDA9480693.1 glucoamylase [Bradyrhizobium sp. CCBAU 11445]WLB44586.1 glycoside hydrolase family 15 protein [Bradyrhizobium ottawaense]WQN81885.1 glycoside hydrolase family 15 protein [Bradyrhizobium ottawaense]BBO03504.1 glucoamylase [Bradyrhizobium ottawaense]
MSQRIEDYALIGDCETAALVGRNGSIDWLCWPAFDSDACFAAILGSDKNGRWLVTPAEDVTSISRRYLGNTLILETRFETKSGTVALIDFMPPRGKASDIVRLVRGVSGAVKMRMELVIRFGFGFDIPWVRRIDHSLMAIAGQDMTVLRTPVETRGEDLTTVADFEVKAGETVPFVLTYGPSHLEPPAPIDPEIALQDTEKFWQDWCGHCTRDGDYQDLVMRSLITLKALTFAPTGGIVAAPTTSLPEKLGGSRNWDYRFCWLRDATFTLLALMNSGYTEEALAWHNWLLRAAAGSPANMQIMYGIWGQRRLLEWEAGWLEGYEGAKPVRVGNAAHAQLQLDVYGELIDAFHQSRMAKLKLDDETTWALECAVLNHLAEVWDRPDHGIWERRGQPRHYVFSKVMTWVAFDRGIKSAETFGFKAPLLHWRTLREAIHRDVCNRGFDVEENAFVESYGSKLLDASVLLLPAVGFLPPSDPRIRGTIAAVETCLVRDGFVLRHDPRELPAGQPPLEGAFLACSLWLADAHVLAGDLDKAQILLDRVAGIANDVGLLAEEYDSVARRQTGNFPQALTHIALINTAHNLSAARQQCDKPAVQRSK